MTYKNYSLEQLKNFLYDAMSTEATPQEIYDVIKSVVEDNYYTYKAQTGKANELLALLNGNGKGHIQAYDDIVGKDSFLRKDRNSNFPNEEIKHSKYYYDNDRNKPVKKTCDKDDSSPECKGAWNDFWEEHYYPEEHQQYTEEAKKLQLEKLKAEVRDLKAKLSRLKNPNFPHYTEEEIDALMAEKSIAKLSK
jgi:hypothetical protein